MKLFNYSLLALSIGLNSANAATQTNTSYKDIADGAVWLNSDNQSVMIATLEKDGVAVYDQQGNEIQHLDVGNALGADVVYDVSDEQGHRIDLAAVALPESKQIAFYSIGNNLKQPLSLVGSIQTELALAGVCLTHNSVSGDITAVGYSEDGHISQFKLALNQGRVHSIIEKDQRAVPVRTLQIGGEVSACASDDVNNQLYIAEKNVGIWAYGADPENIKQRQLLDVSTPMGHISEIEGMAIFYQAGPIPTLVVADQNQGFLLYDLNSHRYLSQFDVKGVAEAKTVSSGTDRLWIGNSELQQPVYQTLDYSTLNQLANVSLSPTLSPRMINNHTIQSVTPIAETDAVNKGGDAADDPAFWYNAKKPEQSLIIATNKKGGLLAYDLHGKQVQYVNSGKPNNVDIRQGIKANSGDIIDLAAASNRQLNTITLYSINDSTMPIKLLPAAGEHVHKQSPELISNVDEVYGLCMSKGEDGTPYVFVNGKDGQIEQWRITLDSPKQAHGTLVRSFSVASQPEGCVVDDSTQTLYVGEEDRAIWAFDARETASTKATLFAAVDDKHLTDDIEGLSLYQSKDRNLLLASSQGNNTYAIFDLNQQGKFMGSFAVSANDKVGVDGTSDTDGIHAVSFNLGSHYPKGMFIAQDFYNVDNAYQAQHQNFKIVDWRAIEKILK
jgi:3-phytase